MTILTEDQAEIGAEAAAEVVTHLLSSQDGTQTAVMSDPARQVLEALVGRLARTANAARRVSPMLLPAPLDDEPADAPVFANLAEAKAWYQAEADTILKTLALAGRYGVDALTPRVVQGMERVVTSLHDIERGLVLDDLALAAARRRDDKTAEAYALLSRGGTHRMAHQAAQAITDYQLAGHLFAELEDAAGTVEVLNRLGVAYHVARRLDEAEDAFVQVLARTGDDHLRRAVVHVNLGYLAAERGELETAITHGLTGLEMLQDSDAHALWLVEVHLILADAYTRTGNTDAAGSHLTVVEQAFADGFESIPARISAFLTGGRLHLATGEHDAAFNAFMRARLRQSISPHPYRLADAIDGTGMALFELNEFEQAVEQHAAALVERRRTGEPFATARTAYYLAKAKAAAGRPDEAAELRKQALLDLVGLVDPAADALRAELNLLALRG